MGRAEAMAPSQRADPAPLTMRDLPDPSDVAVPVRYALVDVFGAGPLTGNPLAVLDLRHCRDQDPAEHWMAAVAREMNQAETTFVLPPTQYAAARLRSFTAGGVEVFGAGHNALGAWWWLLETGRIPPPASGQMLVQEIGGRHLEVVREPDQLVMAQDHPILGGEPSQPAICTALGLEPEQLDHGVPPRVVGTGADHLMVPIADSEALARCRVDKQALADLTGPIGAQGVYVAALGDARPVRSARARFFNPGVGLDEDPATGSAAGPLTAYLHHLGLLDDDDSLTIHQGETMGRPSTLLGRITAEGTTQVGGAAVISAQGWITGPR